MLRVVKELLDPVAYKHVKEMGRRIKVAASTKDVTRLYPNDYLEATLKNKGKARLDKDGNVVTQEGKPWIGGNPFPDGKDALEVFSNLLLSWGRHDNSMYAVRDWEIGPEGELSYQYDFVWVEENTVARIGADGPYQKGQEEKLRFQSVFFSSPNDVKGTSYLNTWYYDQRKFPDLVGYLPAFKRVRKFPTNQRFETAGCGNGAVSFRRLGVRRPHADLGVITKSSAAARSWEPSQATGMAIIPIGSTRFTEVRRARRFFDTEMELIPEGDHR